MTEEKSEEGKRPAVKARKMQEQLSKGARRRNRSGTGPRRSDAHGTGYGNRAFTRYPGQGVSITLQIPPLRRPRLNGPKSDRAASVRAPRRRVLRPVLFIPVLLLAAGFAVFTNLPFLQSGGDAEKAPASTVAAVDRTEPGYKPLVPSAETSSATKYDAKRDLVSYTTTFSGVRVTVSQQAMPASFSKDTQSLRKAADGISAKQKITTSKGDMFIATNEDAGTQMAVYAAKDILLFIHTDRKLDDASWKSFIELLQAKSWEEVSKPENHG